MLVLATTVIDEKIRVHDYSAYLRRIAEPANIPSHSSDSQKLLRALEIIPHFYEVVLGSNFADEISVLRK